MRCEERKIEPNCLLVSCFFFEKNHSPDAEAGKNGAAAIAAAHWYNQAPNAMCDCAPIRLALGAVVRPDLLAEQPDDFRRSCRRATLACTLFIMALGSFAVSYLVFSKATTFGSVITTYIYSKFHSFSGMALIAIFCKISSTRSYDAKNNCNGLARIQGVQTSFSTTVTANLVQFSLVAVPCRVVPQYRSSVFMFFSNICV